jgi:lipoprotein signal peptidase
LGGRHLGAGRSLRLDLFLPVRSSPQAFLHRLTAVDLATKGWAKRFLPAEGSAGMEAGLLDLRLAYNPGVAFGLAADAPPAWSSPSSP